MSDEPKRLGRPPRQSYTEKRKQAFAPQPPPVPPKPFRSPIQDAWPLTMCAELPFKIGHLYEPVN